MDMARVMARRSTCSRNAVGAIVALDGRVLSSGFNGAARGLPHCDHTCNCEHQRCEVHDHEYWCTSIGGCEISVHAEANAVAFAARHGIALLGSTLYATLSPCVKCAQLIVNVGVQRVVYDRSYRDPSGVNLLVESGITVDGVDDFTGDFGE